MNKKYIIIALLIITLIILGSVLLTKDEAQLIQIADKDKSDNPQTEGTYISSKYKFQIDFPTTWTAEEDDGSFVPYVIIRPKELKDANASPRANQTAVIIFPKGYPSDGIPAEYRENGSRKDFILSNTGEVFATILSIATNGSGDGFIIGRIAITNDEVNCKVITGRTQDECDWMSGDRLITEGQINEKGDKKVVDEILASVRYIE